MVSPSSNQKVAVVTGTSSGIGFETSLMLHAEVRRGIKQITDIAKKENLPLQVIQLDVNNDKSVIDATNRIVEEKGSIDVVSIEFVSSCH